MAEVKYALEDTVKQNFLEPLTHLQNKDIRDVQVCGFPFQVSQRPDCGVSVPS